MSDEPVEAEFSLVMPFVVCASKGGPYDDEAFVAGYAAGLIDHALSTLGVDETRVVFTVRPLLVPQLDLLAMRYGFTMTVERWEEDPDEWVSVVFTRGPAVSG